ncbi:unnamed protein product [Didymodactylos carnosus]|uniref:Uncharacterized protein n=1 Tax=Didymodactylos carnosus TaxID=1234261 RepID=A0A815DZY8_9BILA|nr:unnamed protein product [Didymodactylos carnosus]CAF1594270.1 unnamed protein product [Didymodactylos carnosus]CAF4136038.1 unnamed protein product [Didymodactylos carnosus]CAF4399600.1 unnamed protein product [Didymodactylos carnosus]
MAVSNRSNGELNIFTVPVPSENESASFKQIATAESNIKHNIDLDYVYSSELLCDNLSRFKSIERSPYEIVAKNVPIISDDQMPYLTFRTIVLGLLFTIIMAIMNTTFSFRRFPLNVDVVVFQLISLPIGRIMASLLPKRPIKILKWSFSLNPGPFTIKEHALISAMVAANTGTSYAIFQITAVDNFNKQPLSITNGLFLVITSSMIGYGMTGKYSH